MGAPEHRAGKSVLVKSQRVGWHTLRGLMLAVSTSWRLEDL